MPQLLKDGQVIDNTWQLIEANEDSQETLPNGDILVPVSMWQTNQSILENHRGAVGLWINGDEEIEGIAESIITAPVIAVNFPKFVDGRGFSVARLLRDRFGFKGELRAVGQIIRDQLFLLQRCGFNAFQFDSEIDLTEAVKSLADFSDAYQVAADQPEPLFKRR
ncbi:MAG: DUF934 domain-containing protein [Porticoccaceae bacterium]|jgi:uncharacterized protein (DUF934 family)